MDEKTTLRFYDTENPEYLEIRGGEIRFYPKNERLSVSKLPWKTEAGGYRMGKTVTINLYANRGNTALIDLLKRVVSMLEEPMSGENQTCQKQ